MCVRAQINENGPLISKLALKILEISKPLSKLFSLVLLTLDRYIYITRGLRYSTLVTKGRMAAWIITCWLMAGKCCPFTIFLFRLRLNKNKMSSLLIFNICGDLFMVYSVLGFRVVHSDGSVRSVDGKSGTELAGTLDSI